MSSNVPASTASPTLAEAQAPTWRFPWPFWTANVIELFERGAHYGLFISLAVYLTSVVGFTDIEAGYVGGAFASILYLLPSFCGALSDRIGFRRGLLIAFGLLTLGYLGLGFFPKKGAVLASLSLLMVGGAFVKAVITGTVARSSNEQTRARAYSLFYMMVNIGSFTGKALAKPVRVQLGLDVIPLYSASFAALALIVCALFYFPKDQGKDHGRKASEVWHDLRIAMSNWRIFALVLITAGFWAIQGQLYASMPKYVFRLVGEGASPEWYANINPFVVVFLVVPLTQLMRGFRPVTSIGISLLLIPLSSLAIALLPTIHPSGMLFGLKLHPIVLAMGVGIALQGFSECFLSPRYLEYASKQAPKGQEGLYLGFAQMNSFFSWLFGFVLSGYLLDTYCPDPGKLSAADQAARKAALLGQGPMPEVYAHAHYIWYTFAGIGVVAFLALVIFQTVTSKYRQND